MALDMNYTNMNNKHHHLGDTKSMSSFLSLNAREMLFDLLLAEPYHVDSVINPILQVRK